MGDFDEYLREIERNLKRGIATEHTYRPALEHLLESLAPGIDAVNEAQQIECGAPDFIVLKKNVPLGHVEAKDIGKDLGAIEKDEQLTRYREALPNLILTDYLEFRWYVGGEHRLTARLAAPAPGGRLKRDGHDEALVRDLLHGFLTVVVPTVKSPKELATRMAAKAKLIRDIIRRAMENKAESALLYETMEGLRRILISDLTVNQFSDVYAQTVCYGLFAARCNHKGPDRFTRKTAGYDLPRTNPFLREFFGNLAGLELDRRVVWAVDDLVDLLNHAAIADILKDFGRRTRREDPVIHFYETFLSEYDPKLRETRGVYYTPEPVVDYIVRSVDHILKTEFGLREDGLADISTVEVEMADGKRKMYPKVLVLDPAAGTGTFLHSVIDHIHEHELAKGQGGAWSSYVSRFLLPRLFGFELLMAPYAVCHMKLGLQLAETGYDFKANERLGVYLTNTLEEAHTILELAAPFARALMREGVEAGQIKQQKPVMVILGNPPYANFGRMNKGKWILGLLQEYKKGLTEKKLNLDDDFIKFIRFAQWRIEQTGYGVLAFITNHTYLDGLTRRRMRESLMDSFSDIYILDLHGSSQKREAAPDGSKDENVFDIQQGVAIGIFVKGAESSKGCTVRYAELWGTRSAKYRALYELDVSTTEWQTLTPEAPFYFFVPKTFDMAAEYGGGWPLNDMFQVKQNGVKTDRDDLFFDFSREALKARITEFYSQAGLEPEFRERYRVENSSSYNLLSRRAQTTFDEQALRLCVYRPFDLRWLYYAPGLTSRPAWDVMRHMVAGENLALLSCRQQAVTGFQHVFVSKTIAECCAVSIKTREITSVFPLYCFTGSGGALIEERRPNLVSAFTNAFSAELRLRFISDGRGDRQETFGPEDVVDYAYAVFHSPTYRARYAELLKIGFPRLPLTSQRDLFWQLCAKGEELVALHLMKRFGPAVVRFPVEGDGKVEKVRYTEPDKKTPGRVWINKTQYFEGVLPDVWAFHIGGYQVCEKWLKDRKGRTLGYEDIRHYEHVVAALGETIRLMGEIDAAIDAHGGWPIQ